MHSPDTLVSNRQSDEARQLFLAQLSNGLGQIQERADGNPLARVGDLLLAEQSKHRSVDILGATAVAPEVETVGFSPDGKQLALWSYDSQDRGFPLAESDDVLDDRDIVASLEQYGVVKKPPKFIEQIVDESRDTAFSYVTPFSRPSPGRMNGIIPALAGKTTENAGLRELHGMLNSFIGLKKSRVDGSTNKYSKTAELVGQASEMLENLTFIGQKEYSEAVRGLGLSWKAYLDADPGRQICLVTEMNKLDRYRGVRKSDTYMKDRILASFTDEELSRYSGRIVDNLDDLQADPQNARVIMIDDWTISGKGIRDTYQMKMKSDPKFREMAEAGRVEINLLVSSEYQIKNGFHINPEDPKSKSLTVRSYYLSHADYDPKIASNAYITGLHCSVNYGFGEPVIGIAKLSKGTRRTPPMLTRIKPAYRDQENEISITRSQLSRRAAVSEAA